MQVAGGGRGKFGVVLSPTMQMKEVRLLGPGFMAVDCCAVVADDLQAEFIYEQVSPCLCRSCTRPKQGTSWQAVVTLRLFQACNLVVLVHGSHVPATRGKVRVPGGRTVAQEVEGLAVLLAMAHRPPGTGIRTSHIQSASCRVSWGSACGLA